MRLALTQAGTYLIEQGAWSLLYSITLKDVANIDETWKIKHSIN